MEYALRFRQKLVISDYSPLLGQMMLYRSPAETGIALILLDFGGILQQSHMGIVFDSCPDRA